MQVEVTQEDIDAGVPGDPLGCPIALALERATGFRFFVSKQSCNQWGRQFRSAEMQVMKPNCRVALPAEAARFIVRFDRNEEVEPLTFSIEQPRVEQIDSHARRAVPS